MNHGVMFEERPRQSNHLFSPSEDHHHPTHVQHVGQNFATKAMPAYGRIHCSLVTISSTIVYGECSLKLYSFTEKKTISFVSLKRSSFLEQPY